MAKLYIKRVETCWGCPCLSQKRWCRMLHAREIFSEQGLPVTQPIPPADCPLPDAPGPEVQP